jgi:hypothetical protein
MPPDAMVQPLVFSKCVVRLRARQRWSWRSGFTSVRTRTTCGPGSIASHTRSQRTGGTGVRGEHARWWSEWVGWWDDNERLMFSTLDSYFTLEANVLPPELVRR